MLGETVNGSAVGVGGVPGQGPGVADNPKAEEAVVSEPAPMGAARNLSDEAISEDGGGEEGTRAERIRGPRLVSGLGKGATRCYSQPEPAKNASAEQRLLLLDTWKRSGLPVDDFVAMLGGAVPLRPGGPRPGLRQAAHGPAHQEQVRQDRGCCPGEPLQAARSAVGHQGRQQLLRQRAHRQGWRRFNFSSSRRIHPSLPRRRESSPDPQTFRVSCLCCGVMLFAESVTLKARI